MISTLKACVSASRRSKKKLAPTEIEPAFLGVDCNLEARCMYADEEGIAVHGIPILAFEQIGVLGCVLIWKDWVVPVLIVRGKPFGVPVYYSINSCIVSATTRFLLL
jgi:hypothetical protein